jgi:hypothetical protein
MTEELEGLRRLRTDIQRNIGTLERNVIYVESLAQDYVPNSHDRSFLASVGIAADTREYAPGAIPEHAVERIMGSYRFGARASHLYEAMLHLEQRGQRLTAQQYHDILFNAFATAGHAPAAEGAITIVLEEFDALAHEPAALVPSNRCRELIRIADPVFARYYETMHWQFVDTSGGLW